MNRGIKIIIYSILGLFSLGACAQQEGNGKQDSQKQIAVDTALNEMRTLLEESQNYLQNRDIDGDGIKDDIYFDYSGGAHCCYKMSLKLSSMQNPIDYPFEMDGGYSFGSVDGSQPLRFGIEDYDLDGLPEIRMEIATYNGERFPIEQEWTKKYGIKSNFILFDFQEGEVGLMDYEPRLILLERELAEGKKSTLGLTTDRNYFHFTDNPESRPYFRSMLKRYSKQTQAEMVRREEPGQRIEVLVRLLSEEDQKPIPNASAEMVQADDQGLYFEEKSMWNPRIFAYLKTDLRGEMILNTIRPGVYQDEEGNDVPAHIHFQFEAEGFRPYGSEFTFEDDPMIQAEGNAEGVPVAKLRPEESGDRYEVVIYLQGK